MNDLIQKVALGFFERVGIFWDFLSSSARLPFIILDILIVALLFYWLYVFIRETRAWRIFLGLIVIILFMLMSKLLGLTTLNWIFKNFLTVLVVAIPVVFQPELRVALEKLGQIRLSEFSQKPKDVDKQVDELVSACETLSKAEIGALIAIQRGVGLKEYAETGTWLNADISAPLLINIFQKRAPLHDGAVIIAGNKIQAAGCLLPVENTRVRQSFGARHQSALALSKETDALVIVVSEEKGDISVAKGGKMALSLSAFDLKQVLVSELKGESK